MKQRSFDVYQSDWVSESYEIRHLPRGLGIRQGHMGWATQGSAFDSPGFARSPTIPATRERAYLRNAGLISESESLFKSMPSKAGRYVCPIQGSKADSSGEKYDPWTRPNLYREFLNTELNEDGVLRFANRFGRLGREEYEVVLGAGGHLMIVEPYKRWIAEIVRLRTAVRLLALSRVERGSDTYRAAIEELAESVACIRLADGSFWPGDQDILKPEWFKRDRDHRIFKRYYPHRSAHQFLPGPHTGANRKKYTREEILRRMAFQFAIEQVNLEFAFGVSPIATFDPKQPLHYAPRYLLATMYLQFALDLTRKAGTACRWCGAPMFGEVGQKKFCSNACRKKFERNQKRLSLDS